MSETVHRIEDESGESLHKLHAIFPQVHHLHFAVATLQAFPQGAVDRVNRKERKHRREDGTERIGTLIGDRYRIVHLLGVGGMSSVYEARVQGSDERVAIKLLHRGLMSDEDAVARLKREAKVLTAITHPNICRIIDVSENSGDNPFIVMERMRGQMNQLQTCEVAVAG